MVFQTYTCAMDDGTIEFGFCFKEHEADDDCCTDAEIIIGYVQTAGRTKTAVTRELRKGWAKYKWMAEAIIKAPEAKKWGTP